MLKNTRWETGKARMWIHIIMTSESKFFTNICRNLRLNSIMGWIEVLLYPSLYSPLKPPATLPVFSFKASSSPSIFLFTLYCITKTEFFEKSRNYIFKNQDPIRLTFILWLCPYLVPFYYWRWNKHKTWRIRACDFMQK